MLKPLPARIPDTRERTPGSFCTRQLRICLEEKIQELKLNRKNDVLFKWLEARGWGIVKDVGNSFLRRARTGEISRWKRGRSGSMRPFVVQSRC